MKSGEITSTEEALSKIDKINKDIINNLDTSQEDMLHLIREGIDDNISKNKTLKVEDRDGTVFNFTGRHTIHNTEAYQVQYTNTYGRGDIYQNKIYTNLEKSDEHIIDILEDLALNNDNETELNRRLDIHMQQIKRKVNWTFREHFLRKILPGE